MGRSHPHRSPEAAPLPEAVIGPSPVIEGARMPHGKLPFRGITAQINQANRNAV
jgi:hypothetical protein